MGEVGVAGGEGSERCREAGVDTPWRSDAVGEEASVGARVT